jgi:dipeptidyl aminopeptidase/acylaminoacyl peptidase
MKVTDVTCLILLFTLALSPDSFGVEEKSDLFKSRDIFDLEYANDPRISPDGRQIIYERHSMDIMTDSVRSNLWMINSDGSQHRPVLSGRNSFSSPRWSPDGKRLAYITAAEGSPQLYVRWMDTGQTALLTNLTEAPSSITWSPDGNWIAFVMEVEATREPFAEPPKKPENAEWAEPVKIIDRLIYRVDGMGYLKTGYSHIFLLSAEGGTPRQLTTGDFNHQGPLSWTPDSKHILFSANRHEDWEYEPVESEIFKLSIEDGALEQLTDRKGPDANPAVSADGRHIAYLGHDDVGKSYSFYRLYIMAGSGKDKRMLIDDLDHSILDIQWAGRNNIYFLYDDHGVRKLARTDLSGKYSTVAENIGGTSLGRPYTSGSFTVANNGDYATTITGVHQPAELAAGGRRNKLSAITELNADLFIDRTLGNVTELSWKSSFDQLEIQGWVVTPPEFDSEKKYPLILEIHGGPHATYGPLFAAELQRYAAEGYVVLYCNPRGSMGYGEGFAAYIDHNYPGNDYDDLMSGVDALLKQGYIDTDNMFVTGGSGGGVLTAWIVGKTDRFNAAVVAKPVINWTSFVLTSDYTNYFYKYWFSDFPWNDRDRYWQYSPLSLLVGNVRTPTMLLTGEDDYRTPMSESEQFYMALKLQKVESVLVRIPGASHGIATKPSNLIAKVDNIVAWFNKHRTDLDKKEED